MIRRRRGTFLIEMLTVLFMVGIGGSLMSAGLASLLASQDRIVDFGNQLACVHSILDTFQRDVRGSGSAAIQTFLNESPRQSLVLSGPMPVSYLYFEDHIERVAGDAGNVWDCASAQIRIEIGSHGQMGVGAIVVPHRRKGRDPGPHRRFDLFVRCAGDIYAE